MKFNFFKKNFVFLSTLYVTLLRSYTAMQTCIVGIVQQNVIVEFLDTDSYLTLNRM